MLEDPGFLQRSGGAVTSFTHPPSDSLSRRDLLRQSDLSSFSLKKIKLLIAINHWGVGSTPESAKAWWRDVPRPSKFKQLSIWPVCPFGITRSS